LLHLRFKHTIFFSLLIFLAFVLSYFKKNLKFLRKKKQLTQEDFALKVGVNRPIIGSYEEGRAEPKFETLLNISHFFKVKLDDLLEKDLSISKKQTTKDVEGNHLRILPIVVNQQQEEKISLVPIKAAAGYLNGYSDPEFVEQLPNFNLPFSQLTQGTFRAFQIKGDSMLPIPSDSYILGEYLENWSWLKSGDCAVVVSKEEGVVYKRIENRLEVDQTLMLHSDNKAYEGYSIHANKVLEVWRAKGYVSFELPTANHSENKVTELSNMMTHLQTEIEKLKKS